MSQGHGRTGDREPAAGERRGLIAEEAQRQGYVSVAELAARFGLSRVSIRQDLERLERAGILRRVRGGATSLVEASRIAPFDVRLLQDAAVKMAIGRAAAELIRPADIAFLDGGTTVLAVARNIAPSLLEGGGLTIVTRSPTITCALRSYRKTRLITLGGLYVHDFDDYVGEQVENALRSIRVNTLFIGTDGLSLERGVTTDNVLETGLYRLMKACAERIVLVTDSSKIGRDRFQVFLTFDEVHTIITDDAAPAEFVEGLRQRRVQVVLVPRP